MAEAEARMSGVERGRELTIEIDGEPVPAHAGETVAMALFAAGRRMIRRSAKLGAPRGVFCNMGICYECLVYLGAGDGPAVRACMLLVVDGMKLATWAPERDGELGAT
jgi:D-hydroxyproline dehydrogenase subunit gamma